jgi:polysaccharide biosynthesis protein VpsM
MAEYEPGVHSGVAGVCWRRRIRGEYLTAKKVERVLPLVFCVGSLWFIQAVAQEVPQESADAEAVEDLGGGRISPFIRVAGSYTDNFYYQPESDANGNPVSHESVYGWLINSGAKYLTETRRATLTAGIDGEYGTFDVPGTEDDYLDAAGRLAFTFQPTLRNRLSLNGEILQRHDPFGIDRTETQDPNIQRAKVDVWVQSSGGMRYRYGAPASRINAELGLRGLDKRYQNNREDVNTVFGPRLGTRFLDHHLWTADWVMYYNYSPKTAGLIDFSRTFIEFDQPFASSEGRSGDLYQVRTGIRWLATAKTSGDVRAGYRFRTFDHAHIPELKGLDWQAGIRWAPKLETVVELRSGRSEQQSYLRNVNVIDVEFASLSFARTWTYRFKSKVSATQHWDEFVGIARKDRVLVGGVDLEYLVSRSIRAVANFNLTDRNSDAAERDYDRFGGYVGIRIGR